MQALSRRSYGIASKLPARFVCGRRYPLPAARTLHVSSPARLSLFDWGPSDTQGQNDPRHPVGASSGPAAAPCPVGGDSSQDPSNSTGAKTQTSRSKTSKRWVRSRRHQELPAIYIPDWFLDRNVKLNEEFAPLIEGELELVSKDDRGSGEGGQTPRNKHIQPSEHQAAPERGQPAEPLQGESDSDDPSTSRRLYRLNQAIMNEVTASISGGLSMSAGEEHESFASGKSHLKLHCPMDGGTYFLEKIVEEAASRLSADIIRLDAQDLSELVGDYIKEPPDAFLDSFWSLTYDSQIYPPPPQSKESEDGSEADEESAAEEDESESRPKQPQFSSFTMALPSNASNFNLDLNNIMKRMGIRQNGMNGGSRGASSNGIPGLIPIGNPQTSAQQWNDLKLSALLETLIESNIAKRFEPSTAQDTGTNEGSKDGPQDVSGQKAPTIALVPESGSASESQTGILPFRADGPPGVMEAAKSRSIWPSPKVIILIRGFKEINMTSKGRLVLEKLLQAVQQKKKRDGHQVMIVGATSSAELTPEISRSAFENIQNEGSGSMFRTMVVTPAEAGPSGGFYYREERRRTREINLRHLHHMLRRFSSSAARTVPEDLYEFASDLNLGTEHAELSSILEEQVLTFDEVHRIALTAIGNQLASESSQTGEPEPLQSQHIVAAFNLLDESDEIKTAWADKERLLQKPQDTQGGTPKASTANENRLKRLRKQCNSHEKVLLRGVVNPENIRTTFAHVHAPVETITTLKTLTTLSLTRPEAFKYGVLATDKITGCLLYGPPGTGKTLLAKAVAKESGATVLEVSGSDVYDMYVGESEKNVRAIFSLAKKLSPCVVFIDEADAIFASRGSGTNRNSHRELINQFLREWDGMTEAEAFIMVATNRPFDLDDAALRRLPRRLLVDLPVEKDRESILGIHLKDEKLDPAVSLANLAAQTPLYSGSDLKNLAVAAALAAVREENDTAAQHRETTGLEYKFPERRMLAQRHFDKAMEEITASVSEDMSSLGAIRKFDEKYGDRRGRKKRGGYGFTGGEGVKEDSAKVRS